MVRDEEAGNLSGTIALATIAPAQSVPSTSAVAATVRPEVLAVSAACEKLEAELVRQSAALDEEHRKYEATKAQEALQKSAELERKRQLEEQKEQKKAEYRRTMDACIKSLSIAPCGSRESVLDGDQKRTCEADCKKAISTVEDKPRSDAVQVCTDAYVQAKGMKPPLCKVEHMELSSDNEELKRITNDCNVTCKKEAPKALVAARKGAQEEARDRAEASSPCARTLGYQQGAPYSCRTIISACRAAAGGNTSLARGCVDDMIGSRCNACF
jgi:hypothetical protein